VDLFFCFWNRFDISISGPLTNKNIINNVYESEIFGIFVIIYEIMIELTVFYVKYWCIV
jgi:hypothetical protein